MQTSKNTSTYTSSEEYFQILEEAIEKYEYIDGELRMMAGGTANHSIIATNLVTSLSNLLADRPCRVFNSDMQLASSTSESYFFPDAMVVCDKLEFDGDKQTRIKNPVLIVEILSKSTAKYDRSTKFDYYAAIPSLKEYILIHTENILAEGYYKAEQDLWRISNAHKLSQKLPVYSLDLELSLEELYHKTIDLK